MSCERVRCALVLLTAGLLTGHAESSTRLGAILRDDGKLVTVYGPATGPTLEPNPTATHYVFFAQADGVAAWAATTADSLIYSNKATHRAALAGKPRALSIAPNGMFVGVVVDNVVAIYFVDPLSQLKTVKRLDIPKGIAGSPDGAVTLALIDSANFCLTLSEKTYFVGMDNVFIASPKHLSVVRAVSKGYVAYAVADDGVVLATYNGYNNRATFEALGGAADSVKKPSSVALAASTHRVWLSQPGEQNLASIDMTTREVQTYTMSCAGALSPTAVPGVYFWNQKALLDTTGAEPKLIDIAAGK